MDQECKWIRDAWIDGGLLNSSPKIKFLNAQITELVSDECGWRYTAFAEVGNQLIEFGEAQKHWDKFDRILVFYKEILNPRKAGIPMLSGQCKI